MTNQNPLVSIIIPTYNRAHLIGETLDSILAQTYQNWECIVVDDGSTDNTDEVMAEYIAKDSRFQYYHRPEDRLPGGNAARNYGFEVSMGDYINWFDSDDLMLENKLEIQLKRLKSSIHPMCICQSLVFEDGKNERKILGIKNEQIHSGNPLVSFVKKEIIFLTQAPIFERQFIERHNLRFDEELNAAQEWDFFSRCLMKHNDYEVIHEPLVLLRKHNNSKSGNKTTETNWNYTLARIKVYNLVKEQGALEVCEDYLKIYIQKKFFYFMDKKEYRYVLPLIKDFFPKVYSAKVVVRAYTFFVLEKYFNCGIYKLRKVIFYE